MTIFMHSGGYTFLSINLYVSEQVLCMALTWLYYTCLVLYISILDK